MTNTDARKCKTVSFDKEDVFEADLLAFAESKGKFSKYIKRLIQKDREGIPAIVMQQQETISVYEPDENELASFL
ncbi:hypothetical protein NYE67_20675 [Solibacillus sp. FSL W8-0474]|uniref:hypothetical protein n=1 Tax=Solibacillus sp. FSL W8-0474 TaxID=2975336 RepID=UPI0030FCB45E